MKSIGIWGFGKVGKAFLSYFAQQGVSDIGILDTRTLSDEEQKLLSVYGARYFNDPTQKESFLNQYDSILPSPGVDTKSYYQPYAHKYMSELDTFYNAWNLPIIAITGSVGKTTVTHLIGECLQYAKRRIGIGGNIGTPTAQLLSTLSQFSDGAVLEVSSFQLEHVNSFSPTIALWTTFVPNHLDRHGTETDYFQAKYQIFKHQSRDTTAITSPDIAHRIRNEYQDHRPLHIIDESRDTLLSVFTSGDVAWYLHNNTIMRHAFNGEPEVILNISTLPPLTFINNTLMVVATAYISGISPTDIHAALSSCTLPPHRLEYLGTHKGISFYNDSKSTTPASTLAAVHQLRKNPVILLLGGLSKGVDRSPLINSLHNAVKTVICFGAERDQLTNWCLAAQIPTLTTATLDDAFKAALHAAQPQDIILLSPGGSSYDLFTDYQARGDYFRGQVIDYMQSVD